MARDLKADESATDMCSKRSAGFSSQAGLAVWEEEVEAEEEEE